MSAAPHGVVLARYGELWLKGKNRRDFEVALQRNARAALAEIDPEARFEREHGLLVVVPSRRPREVAQRLQDVFGLASLSPARSVVSDPDAIAATARAVLGETLEAWPRGRPIPFRVSTQRSEKRFALTSPQLDRYVSEHLSPELVERIKIDLTHPELELGIHVRKEGSYVFVERLGGAGGLPVGTLGRAVALLSGGIDSPVASWMAMKRGCEVVFLAFHSPPWVGAGFERKIERLVRVLARYQPHSRLVFVPFAEIQTQIREHAAEAYRTVLYRRMMQRIGTRLAREERALALVTGDSLGQVASQTLENLTCIEAATDLPVLRPLVCFDKTETIALARRIGTFAVSIENEPDCCTVFQPGRPVIRGRLSECLAAESALDVEALVERALGQRRALQVTT